MSLKKLSKFQTFDSSRFFGKSQLLFTKIEEWREGETKDTMQTVGTKIIGVLVVDGADYGQEKELNRGESLTIKVRQPVSAFSDWQPFRTIYRVGEVEKASIYGEYRNQLSLTVPSLVKVK